MPNIAAIIIAKYAYKYKFSIIPRTEIVRLANIPQYRTAPIFLMMNSVACAMMATTRKTLMYLRLKKRQHLQGSVYKGNNKVDLVLKFLSQACGLFDELCEQIPYIFQAIDLLVKDGFCETHEGELVCSLTSQQKAVDYDAFTEAAIQESKSYSDRQFLREVISIV
jgi:hypothetical protein